MVTLAHQQAPPGGSKQPAAATAQRLSPPHSGQAKAGSGTAGGGNGFGSLTAAAPS